MKFVVLLSVVCVFGATNAKKRDEKTELDLLRRLVQGLMKEEANLNLRVADLFKDSKELDSVDFIQMWQQYDTDDNGYIANGELDKLVADQGAGYGQQDVLDIVLKSKYVTKRNCLKQFDVDEDGQLSMTEMESVWRVSENVLKPFQTNNLTPTTAELNDIFNYYDKDRNGDLEGDETLAFIKDVFSNGMGVHLTMAGINNYLETMMSFSDANGDNKMQLEEMVVILGV